MYYQQGFKLIVSTPFQCVNLQVSDMERIHIDSSAELIIVAVSPLGRRYYANAYDPENPTAPTCMSSDSVVPDKGVEKPQAGRCIDCMQSVKGAGSVPCRFFHQLAVLKEDALDEVYTLHLPALSIFGRPQYGEMAFQAYQKYLAGHATELHTLVTTVYHDSKSTVPKYFFKPSRPLSLEETEQVEQILDSDDVKQALLFNRVPDLAQTTFKAVEGFTLPADDANSLRGF